MIKGSIKNGGMTLPLVGFEFNNKHVKSTTLFTPCATPNLDISATYRSCSQMTFGGSFVGSLTAPKEKSVLGAGFAAGFA